jgi:hypothetical protein
MNKEEIWDKFCEVNPSFKSEYMVNMSVNKIRKIIETTYEYAYEAGFDKGKLIASQLNDAINRGGGNGMDAFNQIFGNKK